jgi:hypothetical protein
MDLEQDLHPARVRVLSPHQQRFLLAAVINTSRQDRLLIVVFFASDSNKHCNIIPTGPAVHVSCKELETFQ